MSIEALVDEINRLAHHWHRQMIRFGPDDDECGGLTDSYLSVASRVA
jgi:hypothetical protein